MRKIPWASILTIVLAGAFSAVALFAALRGRVWAWLPFTLCAAVLVRELRYLQRSRRGHVGFDAPDRRAERD
ncbi:hypothetical protein HLI28_01170 [Isoptericola sp. JC619]|uniref:Uncharacterized protein n=1 Tax=Isoptericola sediminis TaxID=2733572 RepID=A0A849JRU1_9MICO|nr:hypothetical protein [Isoptericola sediminis]